VVNGKLFRIISEKLVDYGNVAPDKAPPKYLSFTVATTAPVKEWQPGRA
jgi:hypothetical protein